MMAIYYAFTCLFVGVCSFLITFATDLDQCLTTFEEKIQKIIAKKKANATQTHQQIQLIIRDIIIFHADVKQFSVVYVGCNFGFEYFFFRIFTSICF